MTIEIDIVFGVVGDGVDKETGQSLDWVDWPGNIKEGDGTDPEMSITAGEPSRHIGWGGVSDYLNAVPQVRAVFDAIGFYGSNDHCHAPVSYQMLRLIAKIPVTGNRLYDDRRQWFRYWAVRARQEFGDKAVIGIR